MSKFNEEKNGHRAEHGAAALEGWYEACPDAVDEDIVANLTDLVTDVLHYAKREGLHPIPIARMAELHYNEEGA